MSALSSSRLRAALPWVSPGLVLALALSLMRPVLRGGMPVSADHTAHLFQSWDLWTHRLASLRVGGWSDLWFFGYPAGELYHPGADLWVVAWRILGLGFLDATQAYAVAFVAFFALSGLAMERFGARRLGWLAGAVAAALLLLDRGDYEQGGWLYTVRAGVWPQGLGMAFFLLALLRCEESIDRDRPRGLALAALLLGLAVLAHPVSLVLAMLCLPLPWVARWICRQAPGRLALLGPLGVTLLGAGLAAFWWVPLAARTGWTEPVGYPWLGLGEILGGLLRGQLFGNLPAWVTWLGLLGGVAAILRRRSSGVLLLLLVLLLLFGAAAEISGGLADLSGSEALRRFQFRRFTIPAKAGLFLLAGYALQCLWDGVMSAASSPRLGAWAGTRARVAAASALLALGTLGAGLRAPALGAHLASLDLPTIAESSLWRDLQDLSAWLRQEHAARPGRWRVAYEGPEHDQFFWAAPVLNGLPGYKPGFTCCRLFGLIPQGRDAALYRAMGVRVVVSQGPAERPELEPLASFGELHAYAFRDHDPRPCTLQGPGRVSIERFEPASIALRLEGTSPASRLLLRVAHYPRWQATIDGVSVPIDLASPSPGQPAILMELPASDGLVELRYRRRLIDWLGMLLSLLALGATLGARWLPYSSPSPSSSRSSR
jgi:hypothetical protein